MACHVFLVRRDQGHHAFHGAQSADSLRVREHNRLCVSERETASYVCDSERPLPPRLGCMSVLTAGNRRVLNVICTKSNSIPLNTSMLRADLNPHKKIKINEIQKIKNKKRTKLKYRRKEKKENVLVLLWDSDVMDCTEKLCVFSVQRPHKEVCEILNDETTDLLIKISLHLGIWHILVVNNVHN